MTEKRNEVGFDKYLGLGIALELANRQTPESLWQISGGKYDGDGVAYPLGRSSGTGWTIALIQPKLSQPDQALGHRGNYDDQIIVWVMDQPAELQRGENEQSTDVSQYLGKNGDGYFYYHQDGDGYFYYRQDKGHEIIGGASTIIETLRLTKDEPGSTSDQR